MHLVDLEEVDRGTGFWQLGGKARNKKNPALKQGYEAAEVALIEGRIELKDALVGALSAMFIFIIS